MLLTLVHFSIAGLFLINYKEPFKHPGEESLAIVSFNFFSRICLSNFAYDNFLPPEVSDFYVIVMISLFLYDTQIFKSC